MIEIAPEPFICLLVIIGALNWIFGFMVGRAENNKRR